MIRGNARHIVRYVLRPHEIWLNVRRWKRSALRPERVLFVLGAPRSGTTLMHRILLNHSKIDGFSHETDIFSPKSLYDYSRFKDFFEYAIYQDVLRGSADMTSFFSEIHKQFVSNENLKWVIEKTPQHVKRLRFLLHHFPNALFVHLVRDGRDAFCSGRRAKNIPQAQNVRAYAQYWRRCIASRTAQNDPRILDVRYEDFVLDPPNGVARICEFLSVEPEMEAQLAPETRALDHRASDHAFSRLGSEIDAASCGRWREEMNAKEIRKFEAIAGEGLRAFGYQISTD